MLTSPIFQELTTDGVRREIAGAVDVGLRSNDCQKHYGRILRVLIFYQRSLYPENKLHDCSGWNPYRSGTNVTRGTDESLVIKTEMISPPTHYGDLLVCS